MATVETYKLQDGNKHVNIRAKITGDGAASTDLVLYDGSALNKPGQLSIHQLWVITPDSTGFVLKFDGATNDRVATIPAAKMDHMDFKYAGGIKNQAATPSGKITADVLAALATDEVIYVGLDIHKS